MDNGSCLPVLKFFIILTLISTNVVWTRQADPLSQKLVTVINSRTPSFNPIEICNIVFYQIHLVDPFVPDLACHSMTPVQLLRDTVKVQESQYLFRHSPQCLQFISPEVPTGSLNRAWIDLVWTNKRFLSVHFIFLGHSSSLRAFMQHKIIDSLKFKTGIALDTPEVFINDNPDCVQCGIGTEEESRLPNFKEVTKNRFLKFTLMALEPQVVFGETNQPVPGLGIGFNIISNAKKYYNLTVDLNLGIVPFNRLPNGSWQGAIGDLHKGDMDVKIIFIATEERILNFDFTSTMVMGVMIFITSHPQVHVNWRAIVYPFQPEVWMALFLIQVGATAAFYLHFRIGVSSKHKNNWFRAFEIPVSILLLQNPPIPKNGRFLAVVVTLFSIVMTTSYGSNLISYLTLPEPDIVPRTFDQLSEMTASYTIYHMWFPGGTGEIFFNGTTNPAHLRIAQRLHNEADWLKCSKLAVTEPKTACITWPIVHEQLMARNLTVHSSWNPGLQSRDHLVSQSLDVALTKHSKYLEAINFIVGWARDTGCVSRWRRDVGEYNKVKSRGWMKHLEEVNDPLIEKLARGIDNSHGKAEPLSLKNLVLCFAALVGGMSVSSFLFLLELNLLLRKWGNLNK